MWIALDDANEENGALQYAPGSHLWHTAATGSGLPANNVSASSFHVSAGDGINNDSCGSFSHMASLRRAAQRAALTLNKHYNPSSLYRSQRAEWWFITKMSGMGAVPT